MHVFFTGQSPAVATPTSAPRVRPGAPRPATPQSAATVRQATRPATPGTPATRAPVPTPRQVTPQQPRPPRAQTPSSASHQPLTPLSRGQRPQAGGFTELPPSLRGQVKFPAKVEVNPPGGGSLYRAAGGHCGLGQEGWMALR